MSSVLRNLTKRQILDKYTRMTGRPACVNFFEECNFTLNLILGSSQAGPLDYGSLPLS